MTNPSSENPELTPAEILEAILRLKPGQRRKLYRRLRAIGMLDMAGPWADTQRLQIAPAVRRRASGTRVAPARTETNQPGTNVPQDTKNSRRASEPPNAQSGSRGAETSATKPLPKRTPQEAQDDLDDGEYRSGVRSKVVMGAPDSRSSRPLEMMAPVPGQAPDEAIRIIFDGGSRGNPGKGYGSYALDWPGLPQQVVQLRFGDRVTNNEAEYDTLISALEATIKKLVDSGAKPETARLEIFGDSLLVVNQVRGEWEVKNARMRTRCERVKYLLGQFGGWRLEHHDRENSVRVLGH